MTVTLHTGDCREVLATDAIADESVQLIVTSPPFWGLRSYLAADHPAKGSELGAEKLHDCLGWAQKGEPYIAWEEDLEEDGDGNMVSVGRHPVIAYHPAPTGCGSCYVCHIRDVARGLWRVLRKDGLMFINLGDSYQGSYIAESRVNGRSDTLNKANVAMAHKDTRKYQNGLKPKDLCGIPWRVALALQADGWTLRSAITWVKKSCMPESVTDRPTKSSEMIFMFSKAARYYCDMVAVQEESTTNDPRRPYTSKGAKMLDGRETWHSGERRDGDNFSTRNLRDVWTLSPSNFKGAHFAVFPPELPARCIAMGTSARGCCPTCGAPWQRVVSKPPSPHDGHTKSAYPEGTTAHRMSILRQASRERGEEYHNTTQTLGWEPTCNCFPPLETAPECFHLQLRPCTVMDPFAGSGTTLFAAVGAGRDAIGIDLSDEYQAMIRQRLGLFALDTKETE